MIEIEAQKIHLEMGYESIFTFLVLHLGYSESAAQRRSAAMRLIQKAPEIAERLKAGSLNLTQVSELERVTRPMQAAQILDVVITMLAQKFVKQKLGKEPVANAEMKTQEGDELNRRVQTIKSQVEVKSLQSTAATAKSKTKRKYISIKTRRNLLNKAQHQCEFMNSKGQRYQAHSLLVKDNRDRTCDLTHASLKLI